MKIHKWNPETKESLCGKKTESSTAHLHFCNEFLYDPSPNEMKCEKCREVESVMEKYLQEGCLFCSTCVFIKKIGNKHFHCLKFNKRHFLGICREKCPEYKPSQGYLQDLNKLAVLAIEEVKK